MMSDIVYILSVDTKTGSASIASTKKRPKKNKKADRPTQCSVGVPNRVLMLRGGK